MELKSKREQSQMEEQVSVGELEQLRQEAQEERERREALEEEMAEKEGKYRKKCAHLEASLSNLMRQVYDILMSKQSWQIEYDIINKKMAYKDDKIKELELENIRLSEENQSIFCKYDDIAQETDLKSFRSKKGRISKALRGGQHAE